MPRRPGLFAYMKPNTVGRIHHKEQNVAKGIKTFTWKSLYGIDGGDLSIFNSLDLPPETYKLVIPSPSSIPRRLILSSFIPEATLTMFQPLQEGVPEVHMNLLDRLDALVSFTLRQA